MSNDVLHIVFFALLLVGLIHVFMDDWAKAAALYALAAAIRPD